MGYTLIVDDSATERSIITGCLKEVGINVSVALSGEEALEKIKQKFPDLIVLDIVLPGRSGFEICRELKNSENTSKIPIILCSTKGTDMDKFWGKKARCGCLYSQTNRPSRTGQNRQKFDCFITRISDRQR